MEKALNLKGAMIKGRSIVIKKSNRNITNKKRKRDNEQEGESLVNDEFQNFHKNKKFKKLKKDDENLEGIKHKVKEEKVLLKNEPILENKNSSYAPPKVKEESKSKMKNLDFKKFLTK